MIRSGQGILKKIHKKWQLRFLLEIALYGIGMAILVYGITSNLLFSVFSLVGVVLVLSFVWKPWEYDIEHVSNYLDAKQSNFEYSTSLLLQEEDQLTQLARLQRDKVGKELAKTVGDISPERSLKQALITFVLLALGAWLISYFGLVDGFNTPGQQIPEQRIIFSAVDSTQSASEQPMIMKQSVRVQKSPGY